MIQLKHSLLSLVLLAVSSVAQSPIGPVGDMVITDQTVAPDGFSRLGAVANGLAAGLLIRGNKGDHFQLNVVNQLSDNTILQSTSIHWHGLFQASTGWADGPAFINQCPIAKGNSFLYDFTAVGQAGTFWWHSHLSTQYCDGLRGPMVIYDPADPHADLYDVDDESTVLTLADWYHDPAKTLTFPTPASTLFNGLGRWNTDPTADLFVLTVEKNKRYRIRLINMACDPDFTFSIEGHEMTIIEVDGVNHEPLTVDQIQIFAGQRYSFVLNANQDEDNYWIRASPSVGDPSFDGGINSAILRYTNADDVEPTTRTDTSTAPLLEQNLVPLENPGAPGNPVAGGVDVAINLAFAFTSAGTFTVNGAHFTPPSVPVLLQILSGASTPDDLLPEGSVFPLPLDSTIEISMPGGIVGGGHPFHLHGHTFDVVRSAGSSVYNYANPPRRDVVNIGTTGDNVTIRFTTDNAGPWFLHCVSTITSRHVMRYGLKLYRTTSKTLKFPFWDGPALGGTGNFLIWSFTSKGPVTRHIDWHLEAGLAVVFAEGADSWTNAIDPTDQWDQLCPIYDALPEEDL